MKKVFGFAAAAATALTLGMVATPASATITLDDPSCDLYSSTGCTFTYTGNEFDDAALIKAAYDLAHLAAPPPEDLPADFAFLGKTGEGGIDDVPDDQDTFTFTDLPFDVSFYSIKAGSDQIVLFGLSPATDSFTTGDSKAILGHAISHVTFFGGDDGGGGNEIPEPSTWALMILGFGSAGAMLRSQRRRLAKVSA